jgi:predicted RNA-binding Zn-ribbon protein involved in translation (DUF1610 family)
MKTTESTCTCDSPVPIHKQRSYNRIICPWCQAEGFSQFSFSRQPGESLKCLRCGNLAEMREFQKE